MSDQSTRVSIPPKPPTAPVDPALRAMGIGTGEVDDELANNELYQQFVQREAQAAALTDAATATDPQSPSTGGGEEAPDGGASEAPESAPPGVPPVETIPTPDGGTKPIEQDLGEGAPAEGEPELNVEPITLGSRTYTPQELTEAVQVHAWASSLPAQAREGIDAFLSGEYVLVPRGQVQAASTAGSTPLASEVTPSASAPPLHEDDDLIDPAVKARLDRIEQAIQASTSTLQQQQIIEQERQRQQIETQLVTGVTQFQTSHNLTDDELAALQGAVVQAQVLPGYVQQHAGNYSAAMQAAMEAAYWTNPTFRDREVQAQLAKEREAQQQDTTRKTKASALTGTGGSVARVEPPQLTPENRQKEMAKMVAAAMSGGQSE